MFWHRKPQATRVEVLQRDRTTLRLAEWRRDNALCSKARQVLASPDLRLMLDVVSNESPANLTLLGATVEERAMQQARIEGYVMALANLDALAKLSVPSEPIEATFEPQEL